MINILPGFAILMRWFNLIVLLYFANTINDATSASNSKLEGTGKIQRVNAPEVYFINMDASVGRRHNMEKQLKSLGLTYFRMRGNPWNEIYIPEDFTIYNVWQSAWCGLNTTESIPPRNEVLTNASSHLRGYSSIMSGLCGRGKSRYGRENTIKELGALMIHRIYYFGQMTTIVPNC